MTEYTVNMKMYNTQGPYYKRKSQRYYNSPAIKYTNNFIKVNANGRLSIVDYAIDNKYWLINSKLNCLNGNNLNEFCSKY